MNKEDKCYNAWRRSEGYSVPMTEDGLERAEERYKNFKIGWECAIKACMLELEHEHSKNKKVHSFFLIAKNLLEQLKCK